MVPPWCGALPGVIVSPVSNAASLSFSRARLASLPAGVLGPGVVPPDGARTGVVPRDGARTARPVPGVVWVRVRVSGVGSRESGSGVGVYGSGFSDAKPPRGGLEASRLNVKAPANSAHIKQSRPRLGLEVQVLKTISVVLSAWCERWCGPPSGGANPSKLNPKPHTHVSFSERSHESCWRRAQGREGAWEKSLGTLEAGRRRAWKHTASHGILAKSTAPEAIVSSQLGAPSAPSPAT